MVPAALGTTNVDHLHDDSKVRIKEEPVSLQGSVVIVTGEKEGEDGV